MALSRWYDTRVTTVRIEELETSLREVITRVESGETVIVSRNNRPVARLSPCEPSAALDAAFPGVTHATRPASDLLALRSLGLTGMGDAVEAIRHEREDRDPLS